MADKTLTKQKKYDVPIWHKTNLTLEEAAEYSGIGRERLRKITNRSDCPFVLLNIYTDVTKELKTSEFKGLDTYFKAINM